MSEFSIFTYSTQFWNAHFLFLDKREDQSMGEWYFYELPARYCLGSKIAIVFETESCRKVTFDGVINNYYRKLRISIEKCVNV
jgi:hypothetical protein